MEKDKSTDEIGFGTKNYTSNTRYLNPDGSFNIQRNGKHFWENFDGYHLLITMPTVKFLSVVVFGYVVINTLFATMYMAIGVEHFGNLKPTTWFNDFMQLFFFSAQTFTTVGYGHLYPKGNMAGLVATV